MRPPWRAARLFLLRWLRSRFLARSRASFSALAPFKEGGGGPYCYYYCYYYYCFYCYYCSCSEIGRRGVNRFSCCYCYHFCYCYYCYCYYYYSCFSITGRALDIITPPIGFPLTGKALDIIIFFSPSVRKGISPDRSRGWGVLIFSPKFIWGIWRDSPSSLQLKPFKRAASPACPEVVFLIICVVTLVIWVKVPRRGAVLPRAKLCNIAGPSLISRVFRNSLARRAPWRPPPGIIEFIEIRFL